MKTQFTKSTANFGCYETNGKKQHSFLPNESFTIHDVLNADVSLKDKRWFIRYNCDLNTNEWRLFALGCAKCVLHIYEKRYPNDKRIADCLEATEKYLSGRISREDLINKRYAADAAYAAAYAAYAAADAADAAYAAAYAAYAAADAADAAYAAADAADAAYAAADAAAAAYAAADADRLLEFMKDFFKEAA